jgi:hypothetical protein
MVEQSGELHLLVFPSCFAHTRQPRVDHARHTTKRGNGYPFPLSR